MHSTTPRPTEAHDKALRINLDRSRYGTFAEIGAGQEVARWFFRVGGAAGTIAKSVSAYDMAVSDAIYGHAARYVSRERLEAMLDHELDLNLARLSELRGATSAFFALSPAFAICPSSLRDPSHMNAIGAIGFPCKFTRLSSRQSIVGRRWSG